MDLHKLLQRQLNRTGITIDKPPDADKWQEFVLRLNRIYQEADQERYLLERSMDISSREMMGLNEKLERAQHIARLCYWHYDAEINRIYWSQEFYNLLDLASDTAHSLEGFIELVHAKQRMQLQNLVKKALEKQINCTYELQIKDRLEQYRWYRIIVDSQGEEHQLTGVLIDIDRDKKNEEEIKELSQKLLTTARRAGMSEIATSVLHNIGNILNSSNISVNMLKDSMSQPYYQKLLKIIELMKEHQNQIEEFLTKDERGKLIPEYLIALGEILDKEQQKNIEELGNLDEDLQHIKDIVAMQQAFSGVSSIAEKIYIPEVIETALQMSSNPVKDKLIRIKKDYCDSSFIFADKSKVLQILVNLIQNAKDAVLKNTIDKKKQINFIVKEHAHKLQIMVVDNGEGILPENLQRIFSFGFTTKPNGHGFGLHSCALSAQDMGGSLKAESEGIGQGAIFTLTLPVSSKDKGVFNE
ncbi:ATP-binding protein [Legionella cardiaca]|uniref:histidine kinase n=1 Tax=Legionella cardiaca TaxID=1071983 RepID=A0ABY8ASX6_9GAMM|nr:ATP-binding protein [Legionella cardiaca]WED43574.1 ATP-binding protein [Legionella cardiaca]